jgi:hypothetical protein
MTSRHVFAVGARLRPWFAAGLLTAGTLGAGACAAQVASPGGLAPSEGAEQARVIELLQQQLSQVQAQLQGLTQENRALREHQTEIDRRLRELAAGAPPPAAPTAAAQAAALAAAPALPAPATHTEASMPSPAQSVRLWGYGEMYYSYPTRDSGRAQADLARAVFGIGYRFDERTEFNSEYEVEHAVSSASDAGEFEVEQFYVERRLSDALSVRGGLFLMPFGLLNEHHEPTNFYGVQRNFVETLVIPSTWREGGVSLRGDTPHGFGWNVGLTTGFDLSKWGFAPQFPQYLTALDLEASNSAPLQATHQELSLANAHELSQYLALSYYGVPGVTVGAAISSGNAVKVRVPLTASNPGQERVTLWEAHARWTPAQWDLSALYAHGAIGNLSAANAAFPGSPNPIPSAFYGYFLQGAYALWEQGDYRAAPFVRWERYNLGAGFAGTAGPAIPAGLVPVSASPGDLGYWPRNHDRVWTMGANFYIGPHLVVKGDYQSFGVNQDFRRFDLGLGVSF